MKYKGIRPIAKPDIRKGHFNAGPHLFVEIEPAQSQTISCRLPNGKHVTFAFVPYTKDPKDLEMGCVDIHATVGPHFQSTHTVGSDMWTQHLIGFSADFGGDAFDTRKLNHKRRTTLATLLLHQEHYEGQSDRPADAGPEWSGKTAVDYSI